MAQSSHGTANQSDHFFRDNNSHDVEQVQLGASFPVLENFGLFLAPVPWHTL